MVAGSMEVDREGYRVGGKDLVGLDARLWM